MNILVTGATGFVGQHLLKSLNESFIVHALVRPGTDLTKVATKRLFTFNDNIPELSSYLKENRIEGIIHLASLYIAQHQSEQIKELILSNVYLGTALLDASLNTEVRWFLNTGTIWQNYMADSPRYCPVNLYAATKQAFVDISEYYTEISSISFCTLKLCDTYGPGDTRRKILSLFKTIAETGETLDMSPGEQLIDLIHINDVVRGFVLLIEMLDQGKNIEREYVLSSNHPIRLKELAGLYEKASGKALHINWGSRKYRTREVMIPWQKGHILPGWECSETLRF